MDTELSELDKEVLERVRQNREKHMSENEKIEPVVVFTRPKTQEEKKAYTREKSREQHARKKQSEIQDVKTPSQNKAQVRGTISPQISYDGDTVLLTWERHVNDRVLFLPEQIQFKGMLQLEYNTKDKVLTVKPLEGNNGAK